MRINVLDQGYIDLIEPWGHGKSGKANIFLNDQIQDDYEVGIIEAARQSTQASFRGWDPAPCDCDASELITKTGVHKASCAYLQNPGDRKLLKFLSDNKHSTPFEFAGLVLEIQAPIMVFREWHRHRTQSYSEMSARYAPLPDLYYYITAEEVIERAKLAAMSKNRQATGVAELDEAAIHDWISEDIQLVTVLEAHYQRGLSIGVPKEIARKKMPVDHYSRMRAAANLRNWLAFLTLRLDPAAQREIRQYANAVSIIIEEYFPNTWKLFAGSQVKSR